MREGRRDLMKKRREYDDEDYSLWYHEDDLEGKYPIRGLHKTEEEAIRERYARMPILISIPRPSPENKGEILKQVEAKLEAMIEEQLGGGNQE
jgi:hypothetical protein